MVVVSDPPGGRLNKGMSQGKDASPQVEGRPWGLASRKSWDSTTACAVVAGTTAQTSETSKVGQQRLVRWTARPHEWACLITGRPSAQIFRLTN
jgi:hypothetical protein